MSARRPNLLLAISDDQAWPHASAYGCPFVSTPAFDRVAREGVLFTNAYCTSPSCSPSRAGLLTGLNMWQMEEGGILWSALPAKYPVYPDILESYGYHVGHTNKGWGPGDLAASGRSRNPAGPAYNRCRLEPPTTQMSKNDYAGNFREFLDARAPGQPFCFWYGAKEPHRVYEQGSGRRAGKRLEDVVVPPYLPDCDEVRSDLLDYALEIEWFDSHLGRMLALLEERGELDNTLVVVTGDNGLPFPRAKANLYAHGLHVPLALRWGAAIPGGRTLTDFVSFVDLAPTFLQAAGLQPLPHQAGRSLMPILASTAAGRVDPRRDHVSAAWSAMPTAGPITSATPAAASIRTISSTSATTGPSAGRPAIPSSTAISTPRPPRRICRNTAMKRRSDASTTWPSANAPPRNSMPCGTATAVCRTWPPTRPAARLWLACANAWRRPCGNRATRGSKGWAPSTMPTPTSAA